MALAAASKFNTERDIPLDFAELTFGAIPAGRRLDV